MCMYVCTMRPSYRPHYVSCPSVCPSVRLSIRPSVPYRLVTRKQRNAEKIKIALDVPHKYVECQFSLRKVKGQGHSTKIKTPKSLFTDGSAGGSSAADADCTLGLRHC